MLVIFTYVILFCMLFTLFIIITTAINAHGIMEAAIIFSLIICAIPAIFLAPASMFIAADLDIQFLRKIFKLDTEEIQG